MTSKPAVVVLSVSALPVAEEICALTGGILHGLEGRIGTAEVMFSNIGAHLGALFNAGETIIAVMATGAVVRLLAPHLGDKTTEPPVVCVADDGSSVVPALGGHHGANQIARVIADRLGGHAAITTAGDLRFGVALDEPPYGWVLANPQAAKPVMAALLAGGKVSFGGDLLEEADWLQKADLPLAGKNETGEVTISATSVPLLAGDSHLVFYKRDLVVGAGCERGAAPSEINELLAETLSNHDIALERIARVVSIDLKADEVAINALGERLGVSVEFFTAQALEEETHRLQNPSDIVFAEVGCHGVSEGAALAAVGPQGKLIVPKVKSTRATLAVAQLGTSEPENRARSRGHLYVVGIGPGSDGWRSPEVTDYVRRASDLVGYSLYLDLLGDLAVGKTRHDFDLGREEDRVRHAMELAGTGRDVALVCSGDAGIYAMATLVFELLQNGGLSDGAGRIAIDVSPGISALQGAAARAGAPLGHDFCTISLSDLLTPWPSIQMRVKAAAEGDFVIAFYNPVSKRRRTQLAYARDVLLQHRPANTPVILANNLGRPGETMRVVDLADLQVDDVDMLTVVIVGSSDTRTVMTGDGKTWVYTPRGYAAKEGTQIGSSS